MSSTSHVIVPGSQRRLLSGSKLLGLADPHERISITLELRHKKPLPKLTGRPSTPLTRAEFTATYGATQADVDAVKAELGKYNLEVTNADLGARTVEVDGLLSDMEKAFQVKLYRYAHRSGDYRGRTGAIQIPSDLNGIVLSVNGLDDRNVIRRRRNPRPSTLVAHATGGAVRGFLPADLAKLYSFPEGDGAGQSVGILEFGGLIEPSALQLFCQKAGIAEPDVTEVNVSGPVDDHGLDSGVEVMLDIEVVAGVCPKAKLVVYFGKTFDEKSWKLTIAKAIHDDQNKPTVLSISWGAPEEDDAWSSGAIDRVDARFQEAAMLGITVCVASGDDGSADETDSGSPGEGIDGKAHVDFPAASQFVLAVGGTDLRVHNGQATETVWKDGNGRRQFPGGTGTGGGGGGGMSTHFPQPPFQSGIDITSVNAGSIVGRVVPDLAAHAQSDGVTTGYFMAFLDPNSGALVAAPNGGTSAAAPLLASLVARINAILEKEKGAGKRAGYLTPVLYQKDANGKPLGLTVCKDITKGDNISATVGGYKAGPGFDAASGWGSPIGTKLLDALRAIV